MICQQLDYRSIIRCLLVLLCPLAGCTNKTQETTKWSEDIRIVSCDTISNYPYSFICNIFLKDGSLVLINPQNAGEIRILDLQTGQMTYYSMTDSLKGINPALLPLSFYHYQTGRYYHYWMENDRLNFSVQNLRFRGETVNMAVQLNKNKYVILGFFRRLLGMYDTKSKKINYYGHYPLSVQIPYERKAKDQIVQYFQGNIAYSEKHSKIVYCSDRFAYMACYKFTGGKLKFQWENHIVPPPTFRIVDGSLEYDRTVTQGGFSDITIAGDYIFASYSQRNITDSIPATINNMLVYSMNSDHVATYPIDYTLATIVVDLEEKSIYGISYRSDPVIVRFRFE